MVQFPPPATSSAADSGEPGYAPAPDRPSFVFPPPRQSSSLSPTEAGMVIGEQMREQGLQAEQALEQIQNLGTVVADYGNALERKVEPWAVPTVAPLSQTINRRADATFQLSDFMLPGGWTGPTDGHRHPLGAPGGAEWSLGEGWTTGQRTYLAFITPAINRAYEEISFMVGQVADPSQPAANMDLAIYVADENRVLTSQIGTIRISDEIGPGRQLVTRRFPTWVATQGSYIAVAVRQWSGNTRPLLGLHDTPRPLSNVTFPRKITARWTSGSALPGTINGTNDIDFEDTWFTPYIELSEAIGIDYRTFTESWGHGSIAPRPWVTIGPNGIFSDAGGFAHAHTSGLRVSMYDTPLTTDFVRIRTSIQYRGTQSGNRRTTVIFRGSNDMRSGIGLSAIAGQRYELISWSNKNVDSDVEWNDRTIIATIHQAPANNDRMEIDYLDGQVVVRINDVERINRIVTGPQGAAGRFVGLQMRRQAFITYEVSPHLGPWSARDLPQDNGDGGEEGDGEGDDQ